jgi:hypothetical protein
MWNGSMRELISSFTVVRLMLYNADSNESGLFPVISKKDDVEKQVWTFSSNFKKGINV